MVGKTIRYERHVATFKGIHNISKAKTLIVLYDRLYNERITSGLTVAQIHLVSGVPYDTLRSRMKHWFLWGYINRRAKDDGRGKPTWYYTLGARGKHFLEVRVPKAVIDRCIAEIKDWRSRGGKVQAETRKVNPV